MNFNKIYKTVIDRIKNILSDNKKYPNGNLLEFLSSSPKEISIVEIAEQFDRILDKGIVYNIPIGELSPELISELENNPTKTITHVLASTESYIAFSESGYEVNGDVSTYEVVDSEPVLGYTTQVPVLNSNSESFKWGIDLIKKSFGTVTNNQMDEKGIVEYSNLPLTGVDSILPRLIEDKIISTEGFYNILDKGVVLSLKIDSVEVSPGVMNYYGIVCASSIETFNRIVNNSGGGVPA